MRLIKLLPVLLALAVAGTAWGAEGPCGTPENFAKQIETLRTVRGPDDALRQASNCLGDPISDGHPWVVAFNKATSTKTDSADARIAVVVSALSLVRDDAAAREAKGDDPVAWQQVVTELNRELDATRTAENQKSAHPIDNDFWEVPKQPNITILNGAIEPFDTGCDKNSAVCPAYDSRMDLMRVMKLMSRLIGYADYPNLMGHYADAKLLDEQWNGYFNKALPQYWWEVAINGSLMKKTNCTNRDSHGMQLGFCSVPESQFIVLHPATGLQWVNGADNTDELAPAFVVEIFGRNSWKWKNQAGTIDSTLHGQFGWSVITAYSNPGGDNKNWSYGLMVHKSAKFNLGVTTAGSGQYSILVNINLAEWAFARKQEYLDYFKALEKPDWQSLL